MIRGMMRYASLPPALVRGVAPVRRLVPGGVRISDRKALNKIIFLCFQLYSSCFFVKDMQVTGSPRYQCAHWYHPPRKRGGQGVYPPAYLKLPAKFPFPYMLFQAKSLIVNYPLSIVNCSASQRTLSAAWGSSRVKLAPGDTARARETMAGISRLPALNGLWVSAEPSLLWICR